MFDSNCITPGTPFMARLSKNLKYFIAKKVAEDSAWRVPDIIFSGARQPPARARASALASAPKPRAAAHRLSLAGGSLSAQGGHRCAARVRLFCGRARGAG